MKCPFCGILSDKVVDSRESKDGELIRRRRECQQCRRRFTSYESIEEIQFMVVKKDEKRQLFDRRIPSSPPGRPPWTNARGQINNPGIM